MTRIVRILFFAFFIRPVLGFFIGIRVRGKENLPSQFPFIIIANHASHLDTVALMNLFPLKVLNRIRPVAAVDYFCRNKLIEAIGRVFFNILPIERKHISRQHNPLLALEEALKRGESLIIFPEGTRSTTGEMHSFHSGVAHLIKVFPQVAVVPVFMANMGRALPKGEFILLPFICEVIVGEPIFPMGTKEEIMKTLEQAVVHLAGASSWS